MIIPTLTVSDFIAITNQSFETIYPSIFIEGEVESFSINQSKFVFFNLKDEESSVNCFMMKFALHISIEDGMYVRVKARPKITQKGKFSLTIDSIRPIGEGSVKKSFELLRAKLATEGLFDESRKRILPWLPRKIAVISSKQAAGYIDFMKIADSRIKGVDFIICNAQVQGNDAPESIVNAIEKCNKISNLPDVIAIVRGGGSADDLATFNDERVVRAIAASRVPIITGIGHEIDTTLADLVSDVRAATPTHAATILLPSLDDVRLKIRQSILRVKPTLHQIISDNKAYLHSRKLAARYYILNYIDLQKAKIDALGKIVKSLDPRNVLARGYAIMRMENDILSNGAQIKVETKDYFIKAKVIDYERKQFNIRRKDSKN